MDEITNDILLETLIETIYIITIQPLSEEKIQNYFEFYGQGLSLDEILQKKLGCISLNSLIRKYSNRFESFLEIYIGRDKKLYYFNKDVKDDLKLDDFKNKKIEGLHEKISFADTTYFEKHNQDIFLHGRAQLIKIVNDCESDRLISREGYVTFNYLEDKLSKNNNGKGWTAFRKEWFPNINKKHVYEIVFEDLEFSYSNNGKQESSLRLIPNKTMDELLANIENIKNGRIELFQKLNHKFRIPNLFKIVNSSRNEEQLRPPQSPPSKHFSLAKPEPTEMRKSFSDSDSDDDRVENAPYRVPVNSKGSINVLSERNGATSFDRKNGERPPPPTENKQQHHDMDKTYKMGLEEELNETNITNNEISKNNATGDNNLASSNGSTLNMDFDLPGASTSRKPHLVFPPSETASKPINEEGLYTDDEDEPSKETPPPSEPTSPSDGQQQEASALNGNNQNNQESLPSENNNHSNNNEPEDPPKRRGFQFTRGKFMHTQEMTKEAKALNNLYRMKANGTDNSRLRTHKVIDPPINSQLAPTARVDAENTPSHGNFSIRPVYLKTATITSQQPALSKPLGSPPGYSRAVVHPQNNNNGRRSQEPLPESTVNRRRPLHHERPYEAGQSNNAAANQPIARTIDHPIERRIPVVHSPTPRYPQSQQQPPVNQSSSNRPGFNGSHDDLPPYQPSDNYQQPSWENTQYGSGLDPTINNPPPFYREEEDEPELREFHSSYGHSNRQPPSGRPDHRYENPHDEPSRRPDPRYENPGPSRSSFREIPPRQSPQSDNRYYHDQRRSLPQQAYDQRRPQPLPQPPAYNHDYPNHYPQQSYHQPINHRPMSTIPANNPPSALGYRPASVVPPGRRPRSEAIHRSENIIDQFCKKVREIVEDNYGSVGLEVLQNLLKRARLPSHPENIRQLRDYSWRKFIVQYLPRFELYINENEETFLIDPAMLEDEY